MAESFDSRETRDFARETKFLVSAGIIEDVRAWARANLGADPHGTGEFGDLYATTSLYFDTANHDVYHRRTSHARGKFRIRRYGLLDFIFLERKMRTERLLAKRRTTVPLDALQRVGEPQADPSWPGYWFHRRDPPERAPSARPDFIRSHGAAEHRGRRSSPLHDGHESARAADAGPRFPAGSRVSP